MRRKTVKINGKEFELQSIPFKSYLEINDRHTDEKGLNKAPYLEELFRNCVINPKVSLSDFDDDYLTGIELGVQIENFLTTRNTQEEVTKESEDK